MASKKSTADVPDDFFRKIVDHAPVAMALVNADQTIGYINSKAVALLGYRLEDVPTMDEWWARARPDEISRKEASADWAGRVRNALTKGIEVDGKEYRVTCGNGAIKSVSISGAPLDDKLIVLFVDVTAHKTAEDALRDDMERYHALVDLAVDGMLLGSHEGVVIGVNEYLCRLFGMPREAIVGRHVSSLPFTKESIEKAPWRFDLLQKGETVVSERTIMRPDASTIVVEMHSKMMPNGTYQSIYRDITYRRRMETTLRASEERFSKAFRTSPNAYIITDIKDGAVLEVNDAFTAMTGFTREEAMERSTMGLRLWVNEDERRQMVAMLGKNGVVSNLEVGLRAKSGEIHTVLFSAQPIKHDRGDGIIAIVNDITDRKQMEEALRTRESYLSAIIENQPGLLWLKDREGKFLTVNTTFAASCGMNDPALLVGKTDFAIWPRDLAERYIADDARVICSGKPCMVEEPISDKGHINWFETFKAPITDNRGAVIGTTGYSHDITERKKAEEALKKSEERYRRLIELTNTGYVILDKDGNVLAANPEYVRLSGREKLDDLLGRNVVEWTVIEEKETNARAVAKCLQDGQLRNFRVTYVGKNGVRFPVEINATVMEVEGERKIFTLCRDITERKRMEEELQKTQKLESLGVLAGGIAHDFNNLLTGIFGFIDLARSVSKEAQIVDYLNSTLASMGRARALTMQLLTFAKGGAPVRKVTPLFPLISDAAAFALSGSKIACAFFPAPDLWPCDIDKNQINQVVDNIVINAQQAMPNGGAIEITAVNCQLGEEGHPVLGKGRYVKISFKDTGIGIPRDIVPRIFDPFYTTKSKGHGLGLSTCYSIIKRHGGCIDVESEPGKGSTFHVFLPATTKAVATETTVVGRHRGEGAIIVMDDEETVRTTLVKMLEKLGYSVTGFKDGREVLDFFRSKTGAKPNWTAMIFDLTVQGGMGGIETVKELRKLDSTIPLFVASGYADDAVMKNPASFGFVASICKPFTMEELALMLEKHLRRKQ